MQREYGISPRDISTYTMRELADLGDDHQILEQQRAADRQQLAE